MQASIGQTLHAGMLSALVVLSIDPGQAAETVTLVHGRDGYRGGASCLISVFDPDTNFAASATLRIRSSGARKTLLRWADLDRTPLARLVVSEAVIRLYVTTTRNPDGVDLTVHQVTTAWDVEAVTWDRPTAEAAWRATGMLAGADFIEAAVGRLKVPEAGYRGWIEIPLNPRVIREWQGHPATNHGLVIKVVSPNQPGVDAQFRSNACEDVEHRPQLVVIGQPGRPQASPLQLRRRLAGDFVLPAWRNASTATLGLLPTALANSEMRLEVAFRERTTGAAPVEPLLTVVPPVEKLARVEIPIAAWPDGEYLATIRERRDDGEDTGQLIRVLRKQTVPPPRPPPEPLEVAGLTTLMVDDWYLAEREGLRFEVHPAETFPVTTGPLAEGRVMQRGIKLAAEPDGTFAVTIRDLDRYGRDPAEHIARSADLTHWEIALAPRAKGLDPAAEGRAVRYRYYDPERDGPAPIGQVRVQYSGYRPTRWGDLDIPARCAYPVWIKPDGERIVLTREPLTKDRAVFREQDPGEWRDSNDNFGGQWLSRDGTTLYYCQARTIPRCDPFRVPYDNLSTCNRILVVWSTRDGVGWEPAYFDLPTEDDPLGYQHYGVQVFGLEGQRLWLAYLFGYNQGSQQIFLELASSRDGRYFTRFPDAPAFVPNGPPGSWNFGHLHPVGGGVVVKDGMAYRLLGYCSNAPHFFHEFIYNRDDLSEVTPAWLQRRLGGRHLERWPFWRHYGSWEGLAEAVRAASQTVGLMRYRVDGWVSLRPEDRHGAAVTKALKAGGQLALNARTEPGGAVRIEVLDAAGEPLPDYCGENAASFSGDATDATLAWRGGELRELPDAPLRLRITLDQADLYALHW